MNVYRFELAALKKSLFWWCFTILATVWMFVVGVYPIFRDGMTLIQEMASAMPAEYFQAFGFDVENMLGYGGFYEFSYLYFALIGGIMATSTAISVFGREKQSGCQEFLFAKPVSRGTLYVAKLMSVLTAIVVFNICYGGASLYCFAKYSSLDAKAVNATFALLLTQLVFAAIGLLIATYKSRIRTVAELASAVGFVAFVMSALVNVLGIEWLKYCSPLHYFAPADVFEMGGFDTGLSLCALCILVIGVGVTARHYLKSDASKL